MKIKKSLIVASFLVLSCVVLLFLAPINKSKAQTASQTVLPQPSPTVPGQKAETPCAAKPRVYQPTRSGKFNFRYFPPATPDEATNPLCAEPSPQPSPQPSPTIKITVGKATVVSPGEFSKYLTKKQATVIKPPPPPRNDVSQLRLFTVGGPANQQNDSADALAEPGCVWRMTQIADRDPFDPRISACYEAIARDPFQKPLPPRSFVNYGNPVSPINFDQNLFLRPRRYEAGFNLLWLDWLVGYGAAEGVDPLLVLEVMRWESSFKPFALSSAGAGGLMQFMPATAQRFGINPFDERQAIFGGSRYLAWLLRRYQGNVFSALAGYNAGEGAVDAYLKCRSVRNGNKTINPNGICTPHGVPPYAETQKYVAGIWANYQASARRAAGLTDHRQRISVNIRFPLRTGQFMGQSAAALSPAAGR